MQEAPSLPVLVTEVQCPQADHQAECAPADPGQSRADLIDLTAEKVTKPQQTGCVEQRTDSIYKKKLSRADSGHPRQGRCNSAHARQKFGHEYPTQTVLREHVLRAANTGIGLQRNATKQRQYLVAAVTPQVKPDGVRNETRD